MTKEEKDMRKLMDEIDSVNPYATYLSDSTFSTVDEWIDTGSLALNAIISGSMYKGVPVGRVTQFAGPSMCLTGSQKLRVYKLRSSQDHL
jgi:hypothetical protein